jgi:hypothetical protein
METFNAKLGTVFRYNADLSGEIYIQIANDEAGGPARVRYRGTVVTTVQIPAEDFMEFAAAIAGLPLWEPEKDPYDHETTELMVKHVADCLECSSDGQTRCEKYWQLVLERVKTKERRALQ